MVIKGIIRATDAKTCVDLGADGIIVSNHGGRQLDGTVPGLEVLPEICREVGDAAVVMVDGGFRRGTDVVKAIALGARFVFVGRPFLYAAVVGGEAGVCRAIELLSTEVHRTMGMLGVNSLDELNPGFLQRC
jgi:L-lactate dehydrogenase (cytochrome)